MIPKTIHYCWFGGNPKSEVIQECIASWRKHCPDYEIIEWNESNYDVNCVPYVKEAYYAKKWAFVSDYARLDILARFGGIYLDTDVKILTSDPFAKMQQYSDVIPFENARGINTGMMYATEIGSELCRAMLKAYEEVHFSRDDMVVNTYMNKPVIDRMLPALKYNGKTQVFGKYCILGTEEYGKIMHHYGTRSWCDNLPKYTLRAPNKLIEKLRSPLIFDKLDKLPSKLRIILKLYTFLVYDLQDLGLLYFVKLQMNKVKSKK